MARTQNRLCDNSGTADSVSDTSAWPNELLIGHYVTPTFRGTSGHHGSLIIVIKRGVESLTSKSSQHARGWSIHRNTLNETTRHMCLKCLNNTVDEPRVRVSLSITFIIRELGEARPSFGRVAPRTPTTMTTNCRGYQRKQPSRARPRCLAHASTCSNLARAARPTIALRSCPNRSPFIKPSVAYRGRR